ncbi:MAG: hypothetical protein ACHREM_31270, partial [Polyangiales bacterium]
VREHPDDGAALYAIAQLEARLGHTDASLDALARLDALGWDFPPGSASARAPPASRSPSAAWSPKGSRSIRGAARSSSRAPRGARSSPSTRKAARATSSASAKTASWSHSE